MSDVINKLAIQFAEQNREDQRYLRGELNQNQLGILDHVLHRAPQGMFCGDSDDMQHLVRLGLMVSAGRVAWCPDEYFRITAAGRLAWREWRDAQPKPPPISRRKQRSKRRYRDWLDSGAGDCGISFGRWLREHA